MECGGRRGAACQCDDGYYRDPWVIPDISYYHFIPPSPQTSTRTVSCREHSAVSSRETENTTYREVDKSGQGEEENDTLSEKNRSKTQRAADRFMYRELESNIFYRKTRNTTHRQPEQWVYREPNNVLSGKHENVLYSEVENVLCGKQDVGLGLDNHQEAGSLYYRDQYGYKKSMSWQNNRTDQTRGSNSSCHSYSECHFYLNLMLNSS